MASLSQLKALLGDTCRKDQCCGNFSLQYLNSIFNSKKLNAYDFNWFYYVRLKIYVEDGFFAFLFLSGFSFMNIYKLQDSRGKWKLSL